MLDARYSLNISEEFRMYMFISEGPKGSVEKVVQYAKMKFRNYYNLGFGDKNAFTGEIDDRIITNNGDGKKVLTTVAYTLFVFFDHYPHAWVFATGSSPARTRLYQIGICNHLEIILQFFDVFGQKDGYWYPFERDVNYNAFLVKKK